MTVPDVVIRLPVEPRHAGMTRRVNGTNRVGGELDSIPTRTRHSVRYGPLTGAVAISSGVSRFTNRSPVTPLPTGPRGSRLTAVRGLPRGTAARRGLLACTGRLCPLSVTGAFAGVNVAPFMHPAVAGVGSAVDHVVALHLFDTAGASTTRSGSNGFAL